MASHERIIFDPAVMFGKPIVKGARITVEQILCKLAAGMAPEGIVLDHPKLTVDDIRAAEAFAADYLADEVIAFG